MTGSPIHTIAAAATDVGRKRTQNEDSYALWAAEPGDTSRPAETLLVVADGMGGSNAGEVASRMTVDAVVRTFEADASGDATIALLHAIETANAEVWEHSRSRPDLAGMGTTCTALALREDQLVYAHVGDSRAYLVRGGRLRQLTTDHSLVAQLVQRKQLTPEEARVDPRRNVVTRSVGVGASVEIDVSRFEDPLQPGDTLLVCSDGLHGQVSDDELAQLAGDPSLDRACRELIRLANERGGPDNITVVMARLTTEDAAFDAEPPSRLTAVPSAPAAGASRLKARTLQWLVVALVALLLSIAGLAWLMLSRRAAPTSGIGERAPETVIAWR